MAERIKVCYILPFYEEGTDTHLFYNYLLIRRLKERGDVDISVIIEKDQKFKCPPLRFLELFLKCLKTRFSGYKNFYVHYSYYGALAAWLVYGKVFYWNRGMPWLFKRGLVEEQVFRFILRHTVLVTGPESLAKEYVEHYGVRRYKVLSNWVDIERFEPSNAPKADKRTVLFVHHLSKRKGADLIPEIAKAFSPPAGGDVLFLVIGDGPEKENLEKCGVGNVKVLGKVPNSQIPQYFHAADVFLMPSREEGSPHALLEAMASGTPFIASDVGGVRELVPQELERFLCRSEDMRCFEERIKTLLSDKALYDKARAECLKYAKNFDLSRGVEEFINLFK